MKLSRDYLEIQFLIISYKYIGKIWRWNLYIKHLTLFLKSRNIKGQFKAIANSFFVK
jgi:hypothetical protein